MKKTIPTLVVMALILSGMFAATPLVAASSEAGTGQSRTVTLSDPDWNYTNATVVVPSIIDNSTANVFTFEVVDTYNISWDYNFTVSIYDGNVTWYNETVSITSVALNTTEGNVTYTANSLPLLNNANITLIMDYWNGTANVTLDSWYGTIDVVSNNDYAMRVTMLSMLVSLLATVIIMIMIVKVLGSFKTIKPTNKGKK